MAVKALRLDGVYSTPRDTRGKPVFASASQIGLELVLPGAILILNHDNFLALLRLWSEEFGVVDQEKPGEIEEGLNRLEDVIKNLPIAEGIA